MVESSNKRSTEVSRFKVRPLLRVEVIALFASLYFVLFCNRLFWDGALAGQDFGQARSWLLAGALFTLLSALHFVILSLLLNRWTVKPLLVLLFLGTAVSVYFMNRYRIYLDPAMLRNVLATDAHEAGDLMTWSLIPNILAYAGLPIFLLSRVQVRRDPLRRALLIRMSALLLALLVGSGAIFVAYKDLASQMRNHKELRYLITPANYLYSMARVLGGKAQAGELTRAPIGADAKPGGLLAGRKKPVLMVFVLGETARAANWGLSGYARQTTPELAAEGVINFAEVSSCGSNTEVSVPCLFSPWGRRQYDETRILGSESLLDVVARAGFRVVWIENQSGCKGVCKGVEEIHPNPAEMPGICDGERCLDEAMLAVLEKTVAETPGNLMVVMHQMGNHGPAYFKRYPETSRKFVPACEDADLSHCPRETIVNAYDNAIRYTDHILASTVRFLREQTRFDASMLYVSDHGESLGENNLFLHGLPYAIAPSVQTSVPMVMWLSPGYASGFKLESACLAKRAQSPASHDHVFHTMLGMLDVKTSVYEPDMDLSAACRLS